MTGKLTILTGSVIDVRFMGAGIHEKLNQGKIGYIDKVVEILTRIRMGEDISLMTNDMNQFNEVDEIIHGALAHGVEE